MNNTIYENLLIIMPILAIIVFACLFFIKAGYGIFRTKEWGYSLPNKIGWIIMECPAFITMLYLWHTGNHHENLVLLIFFILFELHYFQRTFIFPLLIKGKSRMPVSIMLMGIVFNVVNGFLIGYSLFHRTDTEKYSMEWLYSPFFIAGIIIFFTGMAINLHSDHVIRNLRPKGDTRHYLPQKGMYRLVTSGNYFGELLEWTGFAILTSDTAAWIFVFWTFANLAPRAYAIRKQYIKEFGAKAVGNRKCLIPFIY